jgi:antitoxin HicB
MEYRVILQPDSRGTVLASVPDLPGTQSFGDDEASALEHVQDAIVSMLEFLIKARRRVPAPRRGRGPKVCVPALLAAKVYLHNEMLAQRVTKAELGRRLNQHMPQIDRLVDVRHGSKFDQLEAAFDALGKRLDVSVVTIGKGAAVDARRERAQKRTHPPHARAR